MNPEQKLAEIDGLVSADERARIAAKSADPERVVCPLNVRYVQLPLECIGYRYVCKYLDLSRMACTHPEAPADR